MSWFRYNSCLTNSTQFGNDSNYSKFNGENMATNCSRVTVLALDGLTKKNTLATTLSWKLFPSDHQDNFNCTHIIPFENGLFITSMTLCSSDIFHDSMKLCVQAYLFINWLPGPYWKILSPKSHSPCDVTNWLQNTCTKHLCRETKVLNYLMM